MYKRILAEGHGVGNHTYTHPNCWKVNADDFCENVKKASTVIHSNLFRPPYGKLTPRTLFRLRKKYRIIMWLSVVYCLGHGALALMGIAGEASTWLMMGLWLIAIGSGGIKPCVSAHVGDQFGRLNRCLLYTSPSPRD